MAAQGTGEEGCAQSSGIAALRSLTLHTRKTARKFQPHPGCNNEVVAPAGADERCQARPRGLDRDQTAMIKPKPVVIDTDPGLDDALALILAMRSADLDVRAITVVAGNVPLAIGSSNVLRILEVLAPTRPLPVYEGCEIPLSPPVSRAEHVHGTDGLGGASRSFPVRRLKVEKGHAADKMLDLARRLGKDLKVVALGPLTNVATAVQRDATAMAGIGELVVMGGSADSRGNATATAEFNFYSDPSAARLVVRSGLPVTLVGLNVTQQALLPRSRFNESLHAMGQGPLRSFLAAVGRPYFDFCRKEQGSDACAMHDPLAVGAALRPELIRTETMHCDVVESQGLTRGMMLVHQERGNPEIPPVRVATEVASQEFIELFLATACAP